MRRKHRNGWVVYMKKIMLKRKNMTFEKYLNRRTMLLILITVSITSFIFYTYCTHIQVNNIKNTIKRVAVSAQYLIDGDKHKKIDSLNSKQYKEMCELFKEYRIKTNVYDVYTLIKKDDKNTKIVLASYDPDSTFMEDYIFSNEMKEAYYEGKITVTEKPYTDELGTFYTGYAPLYDSKGKITALVAVDFSVDEVIEMKKQILKTTIILFICMLGVGSIINYLSAKQINMGMKKLNEDIQKISKGDLSVRCDTDLIDIKEIKDFMVAFNEMTESLSFLMGVISKNSKELEDKANHIGELVNTANTSAQIISSIVEQMCEVFENITNITAKFVNKNSKWSQESTIIENQYKEKYNKFIEKFKELGNKSITINEVMKKIEIIYLNTDKEEGNRVLKKYIDTMNESIININKLENEMRNIALNLSDIDISKEIKKDEYESFNKTIIQEFNRINNANSYIADGIEDEAKALEGIVEEIYQLKDIATNLNSNLKEIKIKE